LLDELRERMATYLSSRQVCFLSTARAEGTWAMPVRYRSLGLEVDCLLPRWSDVAYHLEQDPTVMLVVLDTAAPMLSWLQCQGTAQAVARPDWEGLLPQGNLASVSPDDLYLVVRVTPQRLELIDESQGWGVRETLDL
jgi:hypothetical protein